MMAYSTDSKSAAVRAQLDHPVIDGDGHWLEPVPIFLDYLREVAGSTVVERFRKMATAHIDRGWYDMTPAERLDRRPTRPTWWGEPANTLDRATAMIPKLFYERLDDFGIDFAMLYTSLGLFHIANPDEELRRAIARAVNRMNAEMFRPYAHRIAPAAVVPVHTPQEAIDEATYAVRELGMKVIMIANHVRRPVPAFARQASDPTQVRHFVDSLAYESPYDYDPLWARCVELKVAVTAHSGSMGWMGRESVNSFTFNHIGHFATASHAFAKALILGGVVHRFPSLRFAMLEGGVGVRPPRSPSPEPDLQLRRRSLRRDRHVRGAGGGPRAGRARPDHHGRFPGVRLRQRRAASYRAEPGFLQGHGGGARGRQGARALIDTVREWIDEAQCLVALTGAGISTDSGIPDFRGPQGVWTKNPEAEKQSTLQNYVADPEVRQRAWQSRLTSPAWKAEPNDGHRAFVTLEKRGKLDTLITQNIDGLHVKAGSSRDRVIEIHGTMHEVVCLACGERAAMERALARVRAGEEDPPCRTCGGILKSATISFGQGLVQEDLHRAQRAASSCDLMLAVGTKLSVYPIAGVVPVAKRAGARVVILNAEPTEMDELADAVLRGSISSLLPRLVEGA